MYFAPIGGRAQLERAATPSLRGRGAPHHHPFNAGVWSYRNRGQAFVNCSSRADVPAQIVIAKLSSEALPRPQLASPNHSAPCDLGRNGGS